MHIFFAKNNSYYEDLNKYKNQNLYNKKLEFLEIELKKKYENIQNFNPEECYSYSDNSDPSISIIDSIDSPNITDGISINQIRSISKIRGNNSIINQTKRFYVKERILFYKKLIRLFDVLSAFLILFGCILSQLDNEAYYNKNMKTRVCAAILINSINSNPFNNTWESILLNPQLNLTQLMDFTDQDYLTNGTTPETLSYSYNTQTYTNLQILQSLNLQPSMFNYTTNESDYNNIVLNLEIPSECEIYRLLSLITTIASLIFLVCSRYLEHKKDYIYKKEQESKINF